MTGIRIDKWLWAVRIYKTRTLAADACKAGHVLVNGQHVKPSREVHQGEIIKAATGHITRTVRVVGMIERRVGAAVARENAEDLTPPEEYTTNLAKQIIRAESFGPEGPVARRKKSADKSNIGPPRPMNDDDFQAYHGIH